MLSIWFLRTFSRRWWPGNLKLETLVTSPCFTFHCAHDVLQAFEFFRSARSAASVSDLDVCQRSGPTLRSGDTVGMKFRFNSTDLRMVISLMH
jgi:hypothetical protein